jgi:activator of HSP90 ATPase
LENEKLVQEWFSEEENTWDKPSTVTFMLSKLRGGGTKLDLLQKDVPDENVEDIENGWEEYYLGPLKEYLETK